MVDYPKAPENKIGEISQNVNLVYEAALKRAALGKIILIGDSVGGTLITALAQRLITNHSPLPSLIVLISPVMDASFKNENISFLEKADPVLSKNGVLSAKTMCADEGNLEDPAISPINGKFTGFPYTVLFIAEHDITSPDQELLVLKLRKAKVLHRIYRGKAMPHIWPLLPVMQESKLAFQNMVAEINQKLN